MPRTRDKLLNGFFEHKLSFPERNEENYAEKRIAWFREKEENIEKFRESLEEEFGVQSNSKKDELWNLAWEYGHSSGFPEILNYYNDLVVLIQENNND